MPGDTKLPGEPGGLRKLASSLWAFIRKVISEVASSSLVDGIATWVRANWDWLRIILGVATSWIIAHFLGLLNSLAQLAAKLPALPTEATLAASVLVLLVILFKYRRKLATVSIAGIQDRFEKVSTNFTEFSQKNAACDKHLFDLLNQFLDDDFESQLRVVRASAFSGKTASVHSKTLEQLLDWGTTILQRRHRAVGSASGTIAANLDSIIESTKLILSAYTGTACAACIKVVEYKSDVSDLANAMLWTPHRDVTSATHIMRKMNNDLQRSVLANTISEQIIVERQPYWGCDDLRALGDAYRNTRKDWKQFYNATLGVGVPAHWRDKDRYPSWAIICVDNMEGGLNNAVCRAFLLEVAYRVSVMLYRLYKLNEMAGEPPAVTGNG